MLLAAEAGDGWVPLGPTAAKAGRKVATVFEDPSVKESDVEIFRTSTHELQITGTGFNKVSRPTLEFEPALDDANYYVDVSGMRCCTCCRVDRAEWVVAWGWLQVSCFLRDGVRCRVMFCSTVGSRRFEKGRLCLCCVRILLR